MPFFNGTVQIQFYTDSAQTEFPLELIPSIQKAFQGVSATSVQGDVFSIAASGSKTVNLNGLLVTSIYIFSNSTDINVNFNGLGNILFKNSIPGFMPLSVSSLVITNTSSSDATSVTVVMVTD